MSWCEETNMKVNDCLHCEALEDKANDLRFELWRDSAFMQ